MIAHYLHCPPSEQDGWDVDTMNAACDWIDEMIASSKGE